MSIPESPVLTLPQYRVLVRSLPRPTLVQMQHFALFVSNANSWYKHLQYLPPGEPFQFFLDPGAGMQLAVSLQGSVDALSRAKCGFHYSWCRQRSSEIDSDISPIAGPQAHRSLNCWAMEHS